MQRLLCIRYNASKLGRGRFAIVQHNRPTQLLNAIGIEGGIHDHQVLKYQPSVTSRVIFHHLIPLIIIKYWNISLDVTNGWYFRTWWSWVPRSMLVAKSNWVRLIRLRLRTNFSFCFCTIFKFFLKILIFHQCNQSNFSC